jgi:hypothetical protein
MSEKNNETTNETDTEDMGCEYNLKQFAEKKRIQNEALKKIVNELNSNKLNKKKK